MQGAADGLGATCTLPETWGPHIQTVTALNIADSGKGCDLDSDGQANNEMGSLKDLVGSQLADAVKNGSIVILLETSGYNTGGLPFTARVLSGTIDKTNPNCDVARSVCKYSVDASNFDLTTPGVGPCKPKSLLTNAKVENMTLTSGVEGAGVFLPLTVGTEVDLPFIMATFTADVTSTKDWLTTTGGMLCGAITQAAFDASQNNLLTADMDTDGDGQGDAISLALEIEAKVGIITGMTP